MHISVITQHTVHNYGSVLQTYATQQILEGMGHTVEFVDFWRADNVEASRVERVLSRNTLMRRLTPVWGATRWTTELTKRMIRRSLRRDRRHLNEFMSTHIHVSDTSYTHFEQLAENPPMADVYMTGSDQVWNSLHNGGIERAYFLDYAPVGKPRISLAASIGRTELDTEEIPETVALLQKYDAISVREESGVELLASLGISAEWILDPTLILDGAWWRRMADDRKCPRRPYLLVYQLNSNPQMDEYAARLAGRKGWRIVRLSYRHSDRRKAGKCVLCPTVPEFLGLFAIAACCLTDSFHATAFSLNFGIDFISVPSPRFATRIESILKLTETQDRLLSDFTDETVDERGIDWGRVQAILDDRRAHARRFLRHALRSETLNSEDGTQ